MLIGSHARGLRRCGVAFDRVKKSCMQRFQKKLGNRELSAQIRSGAVYHLGLALRHCLVVIRVAWYFVARESHEVCIIYELHFTWNVTAELSQRMSVVGNYERSARRGAKFFLK